MMTNLIKRLKKSESGASAVEYVLLLAIVGGGIVFGMTELGEAISGKLLQVAGQIGTAVPGTIT